MYSVHITIWLVSIDGGLLSGFSQIAIASHTDFWEIQTSLISSDIIHITQHPLLSDVLAQVTERYLKLFEHFPFMQIFISHSVRINSYKLCVFLNMHSL